MSKKKWVIFDFCETLVDFQSADVYIQRVAQRNPRVWVKIYLSFIKLLQKLRLFSLLNVVLPNNGIEKTFWVYSLKGVQQKILQEEAEEFYRDVICERWNTLVLEELKDYQKEGDIVFISSGGLNPYLEVVSRELGIELLFCTQLQIEDGVCTGRIQGEDCMYEQKVNLLNVESSRKGLNELEKVAYSDSVSDLPLLEWADRSVVISYENPKEWAEYHGFEQLILSRDAG